MKLAYNKYQRLTSTQDADANISYFTVSSRWFANITRGCWEVKMKAN